MLDRATLPLLAEALERLDAAFSGLEPLPPAAPSPEIRGVLMEVADRLADNYPYFHPLYAGQMLKPPHAIARLAYALATWINPNNHALDGGRASSAMEKEAVAQIARIFRWDDHLGHLTGGGTMANLEALWVARELRPGSVVLASEQAHYTHARISGVLGVPFEAIACDASGRMDLAALERRLALGGVGTIVATMGTTAVGAVDPLADILAIRDGRDVRVHADAAYGGYFGLTSTLGATAHRSFARLEDADSIVIDPHKHGLQPYGCGCVLFRDPAVGRFYRHDSPYTYFSSAALHLGEISLECSRPGAAAVALWATQRLLPPVPGGEFARTLEKSRTAALALHRRIAADPRFAADLEPELDIVVWMPRAATRDESSRLARRIFDETARRGLHLALADLPARLVDRHSGARPDERVTCLRSVLMKPEHEGWVDRVLEILDASARAIGMPARRDAAV